MLAALLALALASPVAPGWLVIELADPAALGGHRLLHLEDIVGTARRTDIPGLPQARAVALVSVDRAGCAAPRAGICGDLERYTGVARKAGAVVVAVVLAGREDAGRAAGEIVAASWPFPVTVDPHRVARHALGFDGPGQVVLVEADGSSRRLEPIPDAASGQEARGRRLEALRQALEAAARGEGDDPR
jgi:hypothetical protein